MIRFYNAIPKTAKTCSQWNTYKDMQQSAPFYQMLLANSYSLQIPDEVVQAIRCVLVVPASNADPERSFSAANRLTKDERSNLATSTLDSLMTIIQRDDPSILTVKIQQLAAQWLHPRPGLNLHTGRPSTFGREDSLMKEIKTALASGDVNGLIAKHTDHYMTMHGLRTRHDVKEISSRLENEEEAKLAIFLSAQKQLPQQVHRNNSTTILSNFHDNIFGDKHVVLANL